MNEYIYHLIGDNKLIKIVWGVGTVLLLIAFTMGDDFFNQLQALVGTLGSFIAIGIMLPACMFWLYAIVLLPSYLMKKK